MNFSDLVGKTLASVDGNVGDGVMRFTCSDTSAYELFHHQDCCEGVSIEDICGDLSDLIGTPIVRAEESESNDRINDTKEEQSESFTWTFYRIGTIKGTVVIRWYGASNGYYSESVSFRQVAA